MNFDTSFCADVGQVRTGHDADDTFFKMLQELHRVTAGVANGIMAEYKTVRQLMDACGTLGDSVVSDLEVSFLQPPFTSLPIALIGGNSTYHITGHGKPKCRLGQ